MSSVVSNRYVHNFLGLIMVLAHHDSRQLFVLLSRRKRFAAFLCMTLVAFMLTFHESFKLARVLRSGKASVWPEEVNAATAIISSTTLDIPYSHLEHCQKVRRRSRISKRPPFEADHFKENLPLEIAAQCKESIVQSKPIGEEWNLMDESLCRHRFLWISGLHFSGTSLLEYMTMTLPYVSGHNADGWPDEGQHLQNEFKSASKLGGPCKCHSNPLVYMNASDPLLDNPAIRPCLYDSWSRFWNLAKPLLVEKSPMSHVQLAFREEIFPSVAASIISIRHPLYPCYIRNLNREIKNRIDWGDSERLTMALTGWLKTHQYVVDTLKADTTGLKDRVEVLMFEDFYAEGKDPVGELNSMVLNLFPELQPYADIENTTSHRRLNFRKRNGSKEDPVVDKDLLFKWVPGWEVWKEENEDLYKTKILPVLERFEPLVSEFGYSLLDVTVLNPVQFQKAFQLTKKEKSIEEYVI